MTRIRLDYVHEYRDRHGKLRRYFRRLGFKRAALPGNPGSDEFMTAYQLALAGQQPRIEVGARRTKPGTVNAAIVGYYNSLAFRSLAPNTQKMRRAILERFRETHGDKRIGLLPNDFIVRTLSKKSPFAARNWLKTLRGLLQFAVGEGFRADDPTQSVKGLNMLHEHAAFEDGSVSVEAGLMKMLAMMQSGRFKVFKHLNDWWEEFRLYHRKDGKVFKEGDDLMSATRYAVMMLRYAQTSKQYDNFRRDLKYPKWGIV
jgi:hypothetical protein